MALSTEASQLSTGSSKWHCPLREPLCSCGGQTGVQLSLSLPCSDGKKKLSFLWAWDPRRSERKCLKAAWHGRLCREAKDIKIFMSLCPWPAELPWAMYLVGKCQFHHRKMELREHKIIIKKESWNPQPLHHRKVWDWVQLPKCLSLTAVCIPGLRDPV